MDGPCNNRVLRLQGADEGHHPRSVIEKTEKERETFVVTVETIKNALKRKTLQK